MDQRFIAFINNLTKELSNDRNYNLSRNLYLLSATKLRKIKVRIKNKWILHLVGLIKDYNNNSNKANTKLSKL